MNCPCGMILSVVRDMGEKGPGSSPALSLARSTSALSESSLHLLYVFVCEHRRLSLLLRFLDFALALLLLLGRVDPQESVPHAEGAFGLTCPRLDGSDYLRLDKEILLEPQRTVGPGLPKSGCVVLVELGVVSNRPVGLVEQDLALFFGEAALGSVFLEPAFVEACPVEDVEIKL